MVQYRDDNIGQVPVLRAEPALAFGAPGVHVNTAPSLLLGSSWWEEEEEESMPFCLEHCRRRLPPPFRLEH